jgi:hypothetical protein
MTDADFNASLAAVWLVHGHALARLLHHHGQTEHADNVERALDTFMEIVSDEVGGDVLRQAMDRMTESLWQSEGTSLVSH